MQVRDKTRSLDIVVSSVEKTELNKGQFASKIFYPEGFMVLIENTYEGRYELHVYRKRDMSVYVSPRISDMPGIGEAFAFTQEIDMAVSRIPDQIRKFMW